MEINGHCLAVLSKLGLLLGYMLCDGLYENEAVVVKARKMGNGKYQRNSFDLFASTVEDDSRVAIIFRLKTEILYRNSIN